MTRRTAILAAIVLALVLIGTIVYVALDRERTTLDAAARSGAPGKFVQLHDGVTHYDLSGPDSGRTIVLLSGATVPFYMWDPTRDAWPPTASACEVSAHALTGDFASSQHRHGVRAWCASWLH